MSDGFSKDTTPPMKSESPKDYKRCEKCGGAQGYGSAMQGGGLCYCKHESTPAQPREVANERTLVAIVKWLEDNQPDVFRRGLWDAVASAQDESREAKAARLVRESGKTVHTNTCATSIAPAEEPEPCDCDAAQPALPPQRFVNLEPLREAWENAGTSLKSELCDLYPELHDAIDALTKEP